MFTPAGLMGVGWIIEAVFVWVLAVAFDVPGVSSGRLDPEATGVLGCDGVPRPAKMEAVTWSLGVSDLLPKYAEIDPSSCVSDVPGVRFERTGVGRWGPGSGVRDSGKMSR